MRLRVILTISVMVLAAFALHACRSAKNTTNTQRNLVRLSYWDWFNRAEGAYIESQLRQFQEAYPWISVERNSIPDSKAYNEALLLSFRAKQTPDVFELPRRVRFADFQEFVLPINNWATPEWQSRFPLGTFSEGAPNVVNGNIYSFPFQGPGNVMRFLYLNKSLFVKAGLIDETGTPLTPKNYSEMRGYALKITQACNGTCYGFGFGGKDPGNAFANLLDIAQYGGGSFYSLDGFDFKTGKYAYGSQAAFSEVMRLLLGMKSDGSIIPEAMSIDDATIEALFGEGKVAMILGKFSVASNIKRLNPDFDEYEIVAPPLPDSGQKGYWYYEPGGNMWYLSASSAHPQEAWLLMDWLSSKRFAEGWVKSGLGIVYYPEMNKPEYATDRHFADFIRLSSRLKKMGPSYLIRNPATAAVRPEAVQPDWSDVFAGIYTGQIQDWPRALIELDERKQAALTTALLKAQEKGVRVSYHDFIFPDWNQMEDYLTESKRSDGDGRP